MSGVGRACTLLALALAAFGCGGAEEETTPALKLVEAWTAEGGFHSPSSAAFDIKRDLIYVSNLGGEGTSGEGFITALTPRGEIVEQRWIEGFDAPTGLAMSSDSLYVVETDRLISISIPEGKIVSIYVSPDAGTGFNDVAADPAGELYVSDPASSTIYKLWEGGLMAWFSDPDIGRANGLFVDGQSVWTAAYHLRGISIMDNTLIALGTDSVLVNLESVETDGQGGFFVTGAGVRPIYHLTAAGEITELLHREVSSGDLEYIEIGRLLVVPSGGDKVVAYKVEWPG